jgi:hypothetical protein
MPDPQPLGNTARRIVQDSVDEMKLAKRRIKAGIVAVHAKNDKLITEALVMALDPLDAAILAGELMLARDFKRADEVLTQAREEHKKSK